MSRQIYTAESRVLHFGGVLREMFIGLRRSRYLAYRLAVKDIRHHHARSALGFFWDFLDPLVLGLLFYQLRAANVFSAGETGMPYAIFLIYGLMLYQTFSQSVQLSTNIIIDSGGLITQQRVPPEALILSVLYRLHFFAAFRLAVILIFALISGAFVWPGLLLFLLFSPSIILAGMAIGVFLAPFNVIYRDVGRAVNLVLVPLRFVSPVFFVLPATPAFALISAINPFTQLLENLRMLAYDATLSTPLLLTAHVVGLMVLGLAGWFLFHISIRVLSERVGV